MTVPAKLTYRRDRVLARQASVERKAKRNDTILNAYAEGLTWDAIRERCGVSELTLRIVLSRAEASGDSRVVERGRAA
jgi:DNA-directed RNA polymerase specialized sigma24 family protein